MTIITERLKQIPKEPVSILMPICNEIDVIEDVICEWYGDVIDYLPNGSELLVDDCSDDGTKELLQKLQNKYINLRILNSQRDGFFNSAIRLYKNARCPLIFFTDSDGQYLPKDFWEIAKHINNYDMVHGYKISRYDPPYRKILSYFFNRLVCAFFFIKGKDINSAFRLIRKPVLDSVIDKIHLFPMLPNAELYIRIIQEKYTIKNVGIHHRPRKNGLSRSFSLGNYFKHCALTLIGILRLRIELFGYKLG